MSDLPVLRFERLVFWPDGVAGEKVTDSAFTASWDDTKTLLLKEAGRLGAKIVVIQVAVDERGIRQDGGLRADARFVHGGVVVRFNTGSDGEYVYPCDAFRRPQWATSRAPSWQHNVRAVALALVMLRRLDDYGVTKRRQQYQGFKALPGQATAIGAGLTARDAALLLFRLWGDREPTDNDIDGMLADAKYARTIKVNASRVAHPDAGGTTEAMQRVNEAWAVLDRHHRESA